MKNFYGLYCMAVCFVSMIIFIITICLLFNNMADIVFTKYKYPEYLGPRYAIVEDVTNIAAKNNKYIKASREIKAYIEKKKGIAMSNIISFAPWILVSIITFITHFIMYYKSNKQGG